MNYRRFKLAICEEVRITQVRLKLVLSEGAQKPSFDKLVFGIVKLQMHISNNSKFVASNRL